MDSAKVNDWMQVVGIFALVASLIFVGLQMKQSQDIAIATQYQARAETTMNLMTAALEADYVPVPSLQNKVTEEVTARDISVNLWLWIAFDNHYYQYQSGFLEESAWQAQFRNIKELYVQCQVRFSYDWRKSGLRSEFVELIESLDDPCTSTSTN